jgi:hypothetical protein
MKKWIVVVLVVVMVVGTVGVVAAQGPGGGPRLPLLQRFRDPIRPELMDAIENATGLTQEDIVAQLQDGKTFNQILAENNLDPQVVIDAVTGVITEQLDQAVANGRITEERKAQVLANLPDNLDRLMNATLPEFPLRDRVQQRLEDSLVGVVAEMAGVDVGDLLKDTLTPPSLAEIAAEHGLDADAIIATTEQRITDSVNQALADGRMTEEQAAQVLDGLHDRLVQRFNAPFRPFQFFMQGRGRMPGGRMPGGGI